MQVFNIVVAVVGTLGSLLAIGGAVYRVLGWRRANHQDARALTIKAGIVTAALVLIILAGSLLATGAIQVPVVAFGRARASATSAQTALDGRGGMATPLSTSSASHTPGTTQPSTPSTPSPTHPGGVPAAATPTATTPAPAPTRTATAVPAGKLEVTAPYTSSTISCSGGGSEVFYLQNVGTAGLEWTASTNYGKFVFSSTGGWLPQGQSVETTLTSPGGTHSVTVDATVSGSEGTNVVRQWVC